MVLLFKRMFTDKKGTESFELVVDMIILIILLVVGGMFMSHSISSAKANIDDGFEDKSAQFSSERDMYSVLESSYVVEGVSYPLWYVLGMEESQGALIDKGVFESSMDDVFGDGFWVMVVFPASGGSRSYGELISYSGSIEKVQRDFEFFIPTTQEEFKIRLEVVS